MASLEAMFEDYASYHRTLGNKWCHRIGIPLIMFSLFGMLERVTLFATEGFRLDAALALIAVVTVYYFGLDLRFGALMLGISLAMWAIARSVPMTAHVALFLAGWVLQFLGHGVWEKRQPAFLRNGVHLLVGPLWILDDAVGLTGRPRETA